MATLPSTGSEQHVRVGRLDLSLDDLLLERPDGAAAIDLRGKTLFLASCSALAGKRGALRGVVRATHVNTLCGYGRNVDWFAAAAFDLRVLAALSDYKRTSDGIKYLHRKCRLPSVNAFYSGA